MLLSEGEQLNPNDQLIYVIGVEGRESLSLSLYFSIQYKLSIYTDSFQSSAINYSTC